jgi:hypothetical protein
MYLSRQNFLLRLSVILTFFLALAACSPAQGVLPTSAPAAIPASLAVPEVRLLTLDYPAAIHAGDFGRVTLTFEMETSGELSGIQDVFETYNVLAEAQLEMAGVAARPVTVVSEPLLPGQKVTFYWTVSPAEVGNYEGTVWFYLRFVPKTSGAESRILLSSQLIEIDATDLFGMKSRTARWIGFPGIFIGALLGFPFLESALKWVWSKVRNARNGKGAGI